MGLHKTQRFYAAKDINQSHEDKISQCGEILANYIGLASKIYQQQKECR